MSDKPTRDKWLPAALVVALIGAMFYALSADLSQIKIHERTHQQSGQGSTPRENPQGSPPETFWQKATRDPTAVFTLALVGFTGVLAVATIGLGIATYKLWQSSEIHAAHMATSASAAKETVDLSRVQLVSINRAYVSMAGVHYETALNIENMTDIIGWIYGIVWKNTGKTPTKNLTGWVNVDLLEGGIPDNFEFPPPRDSRSPQMGAVIAADGGTITISGHPYIGVDAVRQVQNGTRRCYLWSRVDYNDVFEGTPRYYTTICIELVFSRPDAFTQAGVAPFRASMADKYNNNT